MKYLIWSNEHNSWWMPNSSGYTQRSEYAGRYTLEEAIKICNGANYGWDADTVRKIPMELPVAEEAARKAEGTRHRTRTLVWQALLEAGVHGLTDEGGCEVTGLDASTYRPRRVELVEDGLVRAVGTRPSKHGRQMNVWVARRE